MISAKEAGQISRDVYIEKNSKTIKEKFVSLIATTSSAIRTAAEAGKVFVYVDFSEYPDTVMTMALDVLLEEGYRVTGTGSDKYIVSWHSEG